MNTLNEKDRRDWVEEKKKLGHLRAPFGGCKVCGGGYWHKESCAEVKQPRSRK